MASNGGHTSRPVEEDTLVLGVRALPWCRPPPPRIEGYASEQVQADCGLEILGWVAHRIRIPRGR